MADTQFDWADPLRLDPLLTDEERIVRESARRFCDDQLVPRVRDDFRHERFDRSVMRGMAELGFFGATLPESDGGAGLSHVAYGLIARELERTPGPLQAPFRLAFRRFLAIELCDRGVAVRAQRCVAVDGLTVATNTERRRISKWRIAIGRCISSRPGSFAGCAFSGSRGRSSRSVR